MTRLATKFAAAALLAMAAQCGALEPLPDIYEGPGYISWQIHQDAKLWRMETLLERLRDPDIKDREKAMLDIGFEKFRVGRSLLMPEIIQPIHVDMKWLGIERRKHAILTLPLKGKQAWVVIVFRQDSNDEAYWRPYQFLKFDTDPVEGLGVSFEDILGDATYFLGLRHVAKSDVYGYRKVQSYFKYDEKQLRLTFQETADYYRGGKFQGDPQRLRQELSFKGDQRIGRKLTIKTYPFMPAPEYYNYEENNVKPRKVQTAQESFSFDPQNFSFYDPAAELEKLVLNASPWIRREAARRLGENMKTTHPQLEHALLFDKDPYVRAQCALALANIGDPKALPSLKKALKKYDEPDTLEEAYQSALDTLSKIKASQPAPEKSAAPEAAAPPKAPVPLAEGPKLNTKARVNAP